MMSSAYGVVCPFAAGSGFVLAPGGAMTDWIEEERRAWDAYAGAHTGLARFVEAWRLVGLGADIEQDVRDAKACGVLALDDVGNEPATQASRLREVLDVRYARARPLWVSTAYDADAMARRRGDDVSRRVYEGATVICVGAGK